MMNRETCQYCGHNPVELTMRFERGEQSWEVSLCGECAAHIRQFTEAAMREYHLHRMRAMAGGRAVSGMTPGAPQTALAETPAPSEQELEALRMRRRLSELRVQLENAVAGERYEAAARLRDEIHFMEKEAKTHDGA